MQEILKAEQTQSVDELNAWLVQNPHVDQKQSKDAVKKKCLWSHAVKLSMIAAAAVYSLDDDEHWNADDCEKRQALVLSHLLGFVDNGLKIDYSYHYRTSFLYDVFFEVELLSFEGNMPSSIKDQIMHLYDQYVLQNKSPQIRVWGGLIEMTENYELWKAIQIKKTY